MDATLVHPHALTTGEPDEATGSPAADEARRGSGAGPSPWPGVATYRFSSEQFFAMIDAGIYDGEDRVGLWEGRVYEKMARTQPHAVSSMKFQLTLLAVSPRNWCLSGENPISLDGDKAPLPDLTILRGRPDDYRQKRPVPADIGLIVELAATSLKADTGRRLSDYAKAGVPAYWVADLRNDQVRAYTGPVPEEGRFATATIHQFGEMITLKLDLDEALPIAVDHLLPLRE